MDDREVLDKFPTQLDSRIVKFIAPKRMLDCEKTRQVCMAAGIPTPMDDSSLMETLLKNAFFLNQFLDNTTWTPEALPKSCNGSGVPKAQTEASLRKIRKPKLKT